MIADLVAAGPGWDNRIVEFDNQPPASVLEQLAAGNPDPFNLWAEKQQRVHSYQTWPVDRATFRGKRSTAPDAVIAGFRGTADSRTTADRAARHLFAAAWEGPVPHSKLDGWRQALQPYAEQGASRAWQVALVAAVWKALPQRARRTFDVNGTFERILTFPAAGQLPGNVDDLASAFTALGVATLHPDQRKKFVFELATTSAAGAAPPGSLTATQLAALAARTKDDPSSAAEYIISQDAVESAARIVALRRAGGLTAAVATAIVNSAIHEQNVFNLLYELRHEHPDITARLVDALTASERLGYISRCAVGAGIRDDELLTFIAELPWNGNHVKQFASPRYEIYSQPTPAWLARCRNSRLRDTVVNVLTDADSVTAPGTLSEERADLAAALVFASDAAAVRDLIARFGQQPWFRAGLCTVVAHTHRCTPDVAAYLLHGAPTSPQSSRDADRVPLHATAIAAFVVAREVHGLPDLPAETSEEWSGPLRQTAELIWSAAMLTHPAAKRRSANMFAAAINSQPPTYHLGIVRSGGENVGTAFRELPDDGTIWADCSPAGGPTYPVTVSDAVAFCRPETTRPLYTYVAAGNPVDAYTCISALESRPDLLNVGADDDRRTLRAAAVAEFADVCVDNFLVTTGLANVRLDATAADSIVDALQTDPGSFDKVKLATLAHLFDRNDAPRRDEVRKAAVTAALQRGVLNAALLDNPAAIEELLEQTKGNPVSGTAFNLHDLHQLFPYVHDRVNVRVAAAMLPDRGAETAEHAAKLWGRATREERETMLRLGLRWPWTVAGNDPWIKDILNTLPPTGAQDPHIAAQRVHMWASGGQLSFPKVLPAEEALAWAARHGHADILERELTPDTLQLLSGPTADTARSLVPETFDSLLVPAAEELLDAFTEQEAAAGDDMIPSNWVTADDAVVWPATGRILARLVNAFAATEPHLQGAVIENAVAAGRAPDGTVTIEDPTVAFRAFAAGWDVQGPSPANALLIGAARAARMRPGNRAPASVAELHALAEAAPFPYQPAEVPGLCEQPIEVNGSSFTVRVISDGAELRANASAMRNCTYVNFLQPLTAGEGVMLAIGQNTPAGRWEAHWNAWVHLGRNGWKLGEVNSAQNTGDVPDALVENLELRVAQLDRRT